MIPILFLLGMIFALAGVVIDNAYVGAFGLIAVVFGFILETARRNK